MEFRKFGRLPQSRFFLRNKSIGMPPETLLWYSEEYPEGLYCLHGRTLFKV